MNEINDAWEGIRNTSKVTMRNTELIGKNTELIRDNLKLVEGNAKLIVLVFFLNAALSVALFFIKN